MHSQSLQSKQTDVHTATAPITRRLHRLETTSTRHPTVQRTTVHWDTSHTSQPCRPRGSLWCPSSSAVHGEVSRTRDAGPEMPRWEFLLDWARTTQTMGEPTIKDMTARNGRCVALDPSHERDTGCVNCMRQSIHGTPESATKHFHQPIASSWDPSAEFFRYKTDLQS